MEFEVVDGKGGYLLKGPDGKVCNLNAGFVNWLYFNKDGKRILQISNGFAAGKVVKEHGIWYFVDVNNNFKLCGEGYDCIYDDFKEGFVRVKKGDKQFYVNLEELRKTGSLHHYDEASDFQEGFAAVKKDGKWYYVDKDFNLHGEGYDEASYFQEGFAVVKKGGKWYYVDKNFELHGEGYDRTYDFKEGFGVVIKDGKWYYVDKNFELHGEGYDRVYNFREGFGIIEKAGKFYYFDKDFKLHGEGYDDAYNFKEGFAVVKKGEQEYTINKNFERIKRNNQIMEDVDYLQEAKDDVKSIVGIPAIRFFDEFVKELKAIVLKYFQKKVREVEDGEIEELKSDMKYIKGLIEEKKKQYSQVSPERKRLLKKAESLFGSVNANKNKPDGNSGNTDENNTDDNSSDEEQK